MTEIKDAFHLINKELKERAEKVHNYLKEYLVHTSKKTEVIVHNVLYNGHVCNGKKFMAMNYMPFLQGMTDSLSVERDNMTLLEMVEFCNAEALMIEIISPLTDKTEQRLTKIIIF